MGSCCPLTAAAAAAVGVRGGEPPAWEVYVESAEAVKRVATAAAMASGGGLALVKDSLANELPSDLEAERCLSWEGGWEGGAGKRVRGAGV